MRTVSAIFVIVSILIVYGFIMGGPSSTVHEVDVEPGPPQTFNVNMTINYPSMIIRGEAGGYYLDGVNPTWQPYKTKSIFNSVFIDNNLSVEDFSVRYKTYITTISESNDWKLRVDGYAYVGNMTVDYTVGVKSTEVLTTTLPDIFNKNYNFTWDVSLGNFTYLVDTGYISFREALIVRNEMQINSTLGDAIRTDIANKIGVSADDIWSYSFETLIIFRFNYYLVYENNTYSEFDDLAVFKFGISNQMSSISDGDDNGDLNNNGDYRSTGPVESVYFTDITSNKTLYYTSMFVIIGAFVVVSYMMYRKEERSKIPWYRRKR